MRRVLISIVALGLLSPAQAADSTVSALTAASALAGTELLYCVQSAADRKCTPAQFATYSLSTGGFGSFVGTNVGTTSETLTYKNAIASGITNFVIQGGASQNSVPFPCSLTVLKATGVAGLCFQDSQGLYVNGTLNFGTNPLGGNFARMLANGSGAIDFVSGDTPNNNTGSGAFNHELAGNYIITSGTGSYAWFGDDTNALGFAPTSGTGIFNGIWANWVVNQTGGASGITRGVYVNNTITAAADYRGIEVSDVGATRTAIKTGNGIVSLGGVLINTGITTDATHTDATVCEDTTTHQFYSGSGTLGICLGTSSQRFKPYIAPLAEGISQIMALQPIRYKLDVAHGDPDKILYGFTAEQGGDVLPELMGRDIEGKPNTFDYLGIVPVLVKAVQEQQKEIAELKKQIGLSK